MSEQSAENETPRRGEFCERHFSWLCQAGQGKCQERPAPQRPGFDFRCRPTPPGVEADA